MKRYVKDSETLHNVQFNLQIIVNYLYNPVKLVASQEFDLLDVTSLNRQILNIPEGSPVDTNSDAYKLFIEFVNKVDELLELRKFDVLGESEELREDSESTYRGVVFNVTKTISNGIRISGKLMNTLRVAGHKVKRNARRTRLEKLQRAAESEQARKLNGGNPLIVGDFESIRIKAIVSDPSMVNISNKEFYSYLDALKCIDAILDNWELKLNHK